MVQQMPAMTPVLPEPQTWRDLLATLISDPKERARVVKVTGITDVTLKRWAKWKTKPRPYQLRPLLLAFPYYRDLFIRLIQKEFPTFSPSERPEFASPIDTDLEDETNQIPPDLYEHVIVARFTDAPGNLFWTVCNHVLRPALAQLDPHRVGVGIWVCQCVQSLAWNGERSVCCLRERIQFGTAPWGNNLAPALLLGSESLAGYAASKGLPAVCQNLRENPTFLPIRQEAFEESAAAFPLRKGENIAGCLLVTSTQTDYFTRKRLDLIERYAQLISLAYHDHEFCERQDIQLQELPPTETQQKQFTTFRQRVTEAMNHIDVRKRPKNIIEAEALVWSQLAAELTGMAS